MNTVKRICLIISLVLIQTLITCASAFEYPKVFIEYNQDVNGYKINVEFLSYCHVNELSEIGYAIIHFTHNSGHEFYVTSQHYSDVHLYRHEYVVRDNEHIKLDYFVKDDEYLPSKSPFYFSDMDFDGKEELIIVNWISGGKGGHSYDIYDIDDSYNVIKKTSPPFDDIQQYFSTFDKQSQTIVNSIVDGVWYSAEYHYKKSHTGDFYLYKSIERNGNSETITEY